jgi:hypothetical protein
MKSFAAVALVLLVGVSAGVAFGSTSTPRTQLVVTAVRVEATNGVLDPRCAKGGAIAFPIPANPAGPNAGEPMTAVAVLPNGETVVALSSLTLSSPFVRLYAFTPTCEPDLDFGDGGVAQLTPRFDGLSENSTVVYAIAVARNGDVLVAGSASRGGFLGAVTSDGRLDRSFGSGGWAQVPSADLVTAVAQTPSGGIVVGVQGGYPTAEDNWVTLLNGRGIVETSFAKQGRVSVPDIHDGDIAEIVPEPDGNIVSLTTGGNSGCWIGAFAVLSGSGKTLRTVFPSFPGATESRGGEEFTLPFVSVVITGRSGFELVGTSQQTCVSPGPDPTATGRVMAYHADGQTERSFGVDGTSTFSSPMQQSVWAFGSTSSPITMVGMGPYIQSSLRSRVAVELLQVSPTGALITRANDDGKALIYLPYTGLSDADFAPVAVAKNGQTISIVVSTANQRGLELIRARTRWS